MSLGMRAVIAVALFVGFYVMALGIAAALLLLPIAEILFLDRIHFKLALLCVAGAGIIVWSVLPRFDRFADPGPRLRREDHPDMFAAIDEVAQSAGQDPPAEVFLVPDVNAFVSERGGLMGIGTRRIMGLGLPLLQVLSVSELRAVLAHEFGHFHGGDTALGPWIYKTRAAMGRTIENLEGSGFWALQLASLPFKGFGNLFLRVTLAISRAQEYAADALAARLEGARALATSLRTIHGAALAYEPYLNQELGPVLGNGHRPPVAAGFAAFLGSPQVAEIVQNSIDGEIAQGEASPFDTHPCLRDRLAALDGLDTPDRPTDDRPAISLLGNLADTERELLQSILVIPVDDLKALSWEEVGARVMLPQLRDTTTEGGAALAGVPLHEAPVDPSGLAALGRAWRREPQTDEDAIGSGIYLVQAAVLTTLAERGWTVESLPGHPLTAAHGEVRIAPARLLGAIQSGEAPPSSWAEALEAAGVGADVTFVAPA